MERNEENLNIDETIESIKENMSEEMSATYEPEQPSSMFYDDNSNQPTIDELLEENIDEPDIEIPLEAQFDENWVDPFEALEDDDEPTKGLKKYVIYIAKDLMHLVDDLSTDERTALVNDALHLKLEYDAKKARFDHKKRVFTHICISALTIVLFVPLFFFAAKYSVKATLNNYKQMQQNFEKVYDKSEQRKEDAKVINEMLP